MQLLQWFKDRIGKKVVVSTKDGHNTVKVLSHPHAEALYRTQSKASTDNGPSDYSYRHQEDHEDDYVTPLVYTMLLSELESNSSGASQDNSFQGFGGGATEGGGAGGDFGGGGASASWNDTPSDPAPSSYDSSPSDSSSSSSDSGSFDSGSSDSGSSSSDF